jgi:hypothetical protein
MIHIPHFNVPKIIRKIFNPDSQEWHWSLNTANDIEKFRTQLEEIQSKTLKNYYESHKLYKEDDLNNSLDYEQVEIINTQAVASDISSTKGSKGDRSGLTNSIVNVAIQRFDEQNNDYLYEIASGDNSEIGVESWDVV